MSQVLNRKPFDPVFDTPLPDLHAMCGDRMTIRLADLEPSFRRYEERPDEWDENHDGEIIRVEGMKVYHIRVDTIEEAQGVQFLCPKCFQKNNGPIGTHSVICWSRSAGTPEHATPLPGRWRLEGTCLKDLTLGTDVGCGSRSVKLTSGCGWHGHITDGEATLQ
ncbi:hypothetical protein LCGC14_1983510 [marine sediment metagenome]|uniref:Uncharacterized protein n=1 Tax=marine sediment metagenome TaxID=412755 RepID=A0A0F9F8E2_9ZZZZ